MSSSTSTKSDIEKSMKDTKMNPFEACKQVFQRDPSKPSSMIDKMDLFFTDYSLIPLLVAENYLSVKPTNLTGNTKQQKDKCHLQLLAEASEAICQSDRISRQQTTIGHCWPHRPCSLRSYQARSCKAALVCPRFPAGLAKTRNKIEWIEYFRSFRSTCAFIYRRIRLVWAWTTWVCWSGCLASLWFQVGWRALTRWSRWWTSIVWREMILIQFWSWPLGRDKKTQCHL